MKTLGELEYKTPAFRDEFMIAERDVGYKEIGGGYKDYRDGFK